MRRLPDSTLLAELCKLAETFSLKDCQPLSPGIGLGELLPQPRKRPHAGPEVGAQTTANLAAGRASGAIATSSADQGGGKQRPTRLAVESCVGTARVEQPAASLQSLQSLATGTNTRLVVRKCESSGLAGQNLPVARGVPSATAVRILPGEQRAARAATKASQRSPLVRLGRQLVGHVLDLTIVALTLLLLLGGLGLFMDPHHARGDLFSFYNWLPMRILRDSSLATIVWFLYLCYFIYLVFFTLLVGKTLGLILFRLGDKQQMPSTKASRQSQV